MQQITCPCPSYLGSSSPPEGAVLVPMAATAQQRKTGCLPQFPYLCVIHRTEKSCICHLSRASSALTLDSTEHIWPNIETLTYLHEELSQRLPIQISINFFSRQMCYRYVYKANKLGVDTTTPQQLANIYVRFIQALVIQDIIYFSFPCCHMSQSSHNFITTYAKIYELQNSFSKVMYKKYSYKRPAKADVSYLLFRLLYTGICNFNGKREVNYF